MTKKIVYQNPEMIADEFVYREEFNFQRLTKDQRWYVIYQNAIIAHGTYRNDLIEWIDIAYPPKKNLWEELNTNNLDLNGAQ